MKSIEVFETSVLSSRNSIFLIFILAALFFFPSCDSGDICPDEYTSNKGLVVKATFQLSGTEAFPDKSSYQLLFGAFREGKNEPLISKTILKPSGLNRKISVSLPNIPDEATSLKLCITSLGKQPLHVFFEEELTASMAADTIVLEEQNINLLQYRRVQNQVFEISCVACHGSPGAVGLNLTQSYSYSNLVNKQAVKSDQYRVVPLDPGESFLINILEQGDLLNTDHTSILSKYDDDLNLLKEWIKAGAGND